MPLWAPPGRRLACSVHVVASISAETVPYQEPSAITFLARDVARESTPMNKAFTKESDGEDDDDGAGGALPAIPAGTRNYITPAGYQRLRDELLELMDVERPKVVEAVHWAAKNGDRSENGDYLYGKKRLREIDRRIRFLTKRLEIAEVTDPAVHHGRDQVFFGATVRYIDDAGVEETVRIVGIDEAQSAQGEVSWIAPIARALLKAQSGDVIRLATPGGEREIEVLEIRYPVS